MIQLRQQSKSATEQNPADAAAVEVAKARFVRAVTCGIEELTSEHGYSREHAAETLLRQIRRKDSPPTDEEIFHVMNSLGMGMEDASRTVTVARALRRARSDRGLTSVEAIDDLTKRLSVSSLFGNAGSGMLQRDNISVATEGQSDKLNDDNEDLRTKKHTRTPLLGGSSAEASQSGNTLQKPLKQKGSRPVTYKQHTRKRSFANTEDVSCLAHSSVPSQLASSNDDVESEIAKKKAKFSEDGRIPVSVDTSLKCRSPPGTTARTKRASASDNNAQQLDA